MKPLRSFFTINFMLLLLLLTIIFSGSAFAVDLIVTGATAPYTDVNGTYVQQSGTVYGDTYWKHETQSYYIFNYYSWWTIDTDTDADFGAIFSDGGDGGASSPATVASWVYCSDSSPAPISVSEVSVNPEINLKGNNTSIASGDLTPSFSDHTKFGSALPNSGTATRTFTIHNTGGASLTIGTISFSGTNAAEFTVTSSPSSSVAASGSTTFTVTFTPTGTGDRSATISIVNDDSDENPYTFGLHGYGYTATTLVVSGITTPSAANGNYNSLGVKNNFQYWKHETENYYIFNYLASGSVPAWVIDNDQDGTNGSLFSYSSEAVSPNGLTPWLPQYGAGSPVVSEATPTPEINLVGNNSTNITNGDNTPRKYDGTNFGSLEYTLGSRTRTFTIQNTGTATLTLSGTPYVSLSGATSDFSVTSDPSNSIAASEFTTFVITFDPASEGTKTAVVSITNNDGDEGVYTFTIIGDGITPKNVVLSGVTTPSAFNGTYTYQGLLNEYQYWKNGSYYIYNNNNGATGDTYYWYIDSDTDPASYYFRSANNGENASPVNVTSWTASVGVGNPVIQYAAPEINITGNSETILDGDAAPSIYDHTDFDYTGITSGTVVRTFTIQNTGTETLTLSGSPYVAVGGADAGYFVVSGPASGSIAGEASTTFTVSFDPDALREFNATLSIANNDGDENPYNFSIQGTGVAIVTFTDGSAFTILVNKSSANQVIGRFTLTGDVAGSSLTAASIKLNGTRTGLSNLKLWSSADATFESGSDTQLGSTVTADPGDGSSASFSSFSSSIGASGTYYFLTGDIAADATGNAQGFIVANGNLTLATGTLSGTITNAPLSNGDVSLPVELASFTADVQGNTIVLNWQTATETDNLGFILERAAGNGEWLPLTSYKTYPALKGHGNSSTTTTYTYTDNTVSAGVEYRYRLSDVNTAGMVTMHSPISATMTALPQSTVMLNAYPNPFNPETTINYNLHKDTQVTITVYDLLGRTVKTLIDEQQPAGSYRAIWNGMDNAGAQAASGAYLVRMQTAEVTMTQKVLLLK